MRNRKVKARSRRDVGVEALGLFLMRIVFLAIASMVAASVAVPSEAQERGIPPTVMDEVSEIKQRRAGGDFDQAEARARALIATARATYGESSLATATAIDALVEVLYSKHTVDPSEILGLAQRAVELKEALSDPDSLNLAVSLTNLGIVFRRLDRLQEAEAAIRRGLEIRDRAPGQERIRESLQALATVLTEMSRYKEAATCFERDLAISHASAKPDDSEMTKTLYNYARLLLRMGDYPAARDRYAEALEIAKRTKNEVGIPYLLNGLGEVHGELSEYADSRRAFEECLARMKTGWDHPVAASCANNLAFVYCELGDYRKASELYEKALDMAVRSNDLHAEALITGHLGDVSYLMGDYSKARGLDERAIHLLEDTRGDDHPEVATRLSLLAAVQYEMGEYDDARQNLMRARNINISSVGPDHKDVGRSLAALAQIAHKTGDLKFAARQYREALANLSESVGESHPDWARCAHGLAMVLADQKQTGKAIALALLAERAAREHVSLLIRALPEREALAYSSVGVKSLDLAVSLLDEATPPQTVRLVWDSVIRSRGLVQSEIASRLATLQQVMDPEIKDAFTAYSNASRALANLVVRGPEHTAHAAYAAEVDSARARQERAAMALADASSAFKGELARQRVGLADVESHIPSEATLIAFVRYESEGSAQGNEYAVFVLSPGSAPVHQNLGEASEIDSLVSTWYRHIFATSIVDRANTRALEQEIRSDGERLRQRIWDPVASYVRNKHSVFIVPDGAINLVSFAALPADDSTYLVESVPTMHCLTTERDLVREVASGHGDGLTLVGGVDYDADPDSFVITAYSQDSRTGESLRDIQAPCASLQELAFRHLPGTLQEADSIAALWSRVNSDKARVAYLKGPHAGESDVKARMAGSRVCHLATHGFYLDGDCTVGSSTTRAIETVRLLPSAALAPLVHDNPLLFAGLALSGANQRVRTGPDQDDGILTAEEIAALDLHGVEWAVLSACRTGVGEIRAGEGVLGLRWAFQVAGVRTLIASLWSVSDEATREWMVTLYRNRLERGMTSAEATCTTMRSILLRRRQQGESTNPFFWGAFVACGDWR